MRPLTFINGVILGSTTALGGVCGVILFFRYVLMRDSGLDQSVVQSALPLGELGRNTLMFSGLAVLAGVAFWGQVARRLWRWLAEIALVLGLAAVVIWLVAASGNRDRDLMALGVIAFVVLVLGVAGWRTGLFKLASTWLGDD